MAQSLFDELAERLRANRAELEQEIDRILAENRERFQYTLQHGRVRFQREIRRLQRSYRVGLWRYVASAPLLFILTAPLIYSLIVPLLLLDISLTLYQQICFRIYSIPRVRRSAFIVIDRHHLAYLNPIEKLNCVYCGYGNGLIEYAREISSRTEQYWCPIKHARRSGDPHRRVERFFDYADAEAFRQGQESLRRQWP